MSQNHNFRRSLLLLFGCLAPFGTWALDDISTISTPSTTTEEPHCITPTTGKLMTLYEYYSDVTGNRPLDMNGTEFHLNNKQLVIYSGSFHYFRTLPERWEDLLRKYRAAGLNTVQIYVPWNLHEDIPDAFDFESPGLDLNRLLGLIKANDMFAIVRPGPYICAEWEFGGFPSWLLRDPTMKLRTRHPYFMNRTEKYFRRVMSIVNRHQWSVTGGPVIMLQLENEYFGAPGDLEHDLDYLRALRRIVRESGYKEALFTSDPLGVWAFHNLTEIFPEGDVLETANFNQKAKEYLASLRQKQPEKPLFVTEFWSGWFDQWGEKHHKVATNFFETELRDIVFTSNSSVNFYMFFGGTNFGFMNGARVTTSYDYDSPISEDGSYADKYRVVQQIYREMVQKGRLPNLELPPKPVLKPMNAKIVSSEVEAKWYVPYEVLVSNAAHVQTTVPLTMEQLDLGDNFGEKYGQRYGFILYRIQANFSAKIIHIKGQFYDRTMFIRDGIAFTIIPKSGDAINITPKTASSQAIVTYDFLTENQGRQNHQLKMDDERKGLSPNGSIMLDEHLVNNYTIYALDFNRTFMNNILLYSNRQPIPAIIPASEPPALYIAETVFDSISDVWLSLPDWKRGQIFVNEFNLGRYDNYDGPQTRFFVPKELLKIGINQISLFETYHPGKMIKFEFH